MKKVEELLLQINRIKEIVDGWNTSGAVKAIERKVVKDYLAKVYENLHELKPTSEEFVSAKTIEITPEPQPMQEITNENIVEEIASEIEIDIENDNNTKPQNQQQASVLGESIQRKRVLYDDFGQKDDIILTSISDLSKGIGLNDKFLFAKELFGGNAQRFEQTVSTLNAMNSFDEAVEFINSNFTWNEDDAVAKHFMSLVKRRFL